ncbi:MAG TPA: pyridoxamine 5'-phosphate oxidase family protein [Verrucomicrobiae bacterium]|nr:pyridoxamine 5'-phosphate oxidase family protein [Verrucomicrobiae bacterium]
MNRREQIKLTPDEQTAFLRDTRKVSLATIGKDGYPHLVAMNYVAIDGVIYMSSYGKAQKVLNIRRDPKVAVMAESGRNYAQLRGVMIRGECEILEDRASVEKYMGAIRRRDTGEANIPPMPEQIVTKRVILKVVPKKITSWDHSKLGGRY